MSSESGGLWTDFNLLTPTGVAFQHAIDNQYITVAEFIQHPMVVDGIGLKSTDAIYTSGYLDKLLLRASTWINRYTSRHFDIQTIDETYPYTMIKRDYLSQLTINLNEYPIRKINTIYFQTLKYFTQFSLDYLQVNPEAGYYQVSPLITSTGAVSVPQSALENPQGTRIWTNYTFGYDAIPADITEAVVMLASKFIANQRNPIGLTDFKTASLGMSWDAQKDPLIAQIKEILDPYKKISLRMV